jgi:hypothetical protein
MDEEEEEEDRSRDCLMLAEGNLAGSAIACGHEDQQTTRGTTCGTYVLARSSNPSSCSSPSRKPVFR